MSLLDEISQKKNLILLSVCIALIQIAGYYIVSATLRADGALAIAQPDTLLYCQAARRIVEGFPFSFSAGTAASTGTTSVLYPFVLAPLYLAGFRGDSFITAGFLLNALFYVLFVVAWCKVALRVFEDCPQSRLVASLLLAAFGPFAFCALAQSDTGLWMAFSGWLAYGLLTDRKRLYFPLLVIAPWVRPEGMVVVLAYAFFSAVNVLRRRRVGAESVAAAVAVASSLGVFALNYALTGEFQFSSVAHKGYFKFMSPASAVYMTAIDFMHIVKAYFLGLPQTAPRDFFFIPLFGAAFVWIGVFSRTWKGVTWRELAWYLAVFGSVVMVATSGWQNKNLDRYLMWVMPVLLLYMAKGVSTVSGRLATPAARALPGAAAVLFTCAMAVVLVGVFRHSVIYTDALRKFARRCDAIVPEGASVGVWSTSGIAYEMPGRRVAQLSGIYSPEFLAPDSIEAKFEILKNEPETRFDYWICKSVEERSLYCDKPDAVTGPAMLVAPPEYELRRSDWSAYDASAAEPSASNGVLRARVDVVYDRDERAAAYEQITRDDYPLFAPFFRVGRVAGRDDSPDIVDAGRFLLGGDAMTVPLEPGRDVHVVMRTALKGASRVVCELSRGSSEFSLKSPMRLRVLVDGADAGDAVFDVAEGDFCDARFTIPGRFIASSAPRLTFLGEHIAFCYWFYQ